MREQFLQYIWKYQLFEKQNLMTTEGKKIHVIKTGFLNENKGPDFLEAEIKIDDIKWAGKVEVHIKSSDWLSHTHQNDKNYDNVVLHVVWLHNKDITYPNGEKIPVLELKNWVDKNLIEKYNNYFDTKNEILCADKIQNIDPFVLNSMVYKSLVERLEMKAQEVFTLLQKNQNDWQETTYQMLARAFGVNLNQHNFLLLSQSLPHKVLLKHLGNEFQFLSLIFGQSGLIEKPEIDEYTKLLYEEYLFLKNKYTLESHLKRFQWSFHRTRPTNFPTIRIVQFALILNKIPNLFDFIIHTQSLEEIKKEIQIPMTNYWLQHYDFGKPWSNAKKNLSISNDFIKLLIINAFIPILVSHALYYKDDDLMDRAVNWTEKLKSEDNNITRKLTSLGFQNKNAADSQGLIHLYKNHCKLKNCLNCNIGVKVFIV